MKVKDLKYLGEVSSSLGNTPDSKRIYPHFIEKLTSLKLPHLWTIGGLSDGNYVIVAFGTGSEIPEGFKLIRVKNVVELSDLINIPSNSEIDYICLFNNYIKVTYKDQVEKEIMFLRIETI